MFVLLLIAPSFAFAQAITANGEHGRQGLPPGPWLVKGYGTATNIPANSIVQINVEFRKVANPADITVQTFVIGTSAPANGTVPYDTGWLQPNVALAVGDKWYTRVTLTYTPPGQQPVVLQFVDSVKYTI